MIVKIFQSRIYYFFFMCVNVLHIVPFNVNHSEAFTVWLESSSVDELQPKQQRVKAVPHVDAKVRPKHDILKILGADEANHQFVLLYFFKILCLF